MSQQPQINEMINLLQVFEPKTLDNIRVSNPQYKNILKLGAVLGENENETELKIRAQVCDSSLKFIKNKCTEVLPRLKSLIINNKRLKFWSLILTTISSATVIISLLSEKYKDYTIILGAISLLGTLIQVYLEFKSKSIDNKTTIEEIYTDLTKKEIESEHYSKELNFYLNNNFKNDGVIEIISQSNKLCSEMSTLLSLI
jgi:hypothetical protein